MFEAQLDFNDLDGSNGFVINGNSGEAFGDSVSSAGDVNGDGIEDIIIGAPGTSTISPGRSYVLFGDTSGAIGSSFDVSDLDGTNGFVINGVVDQSSSGDSVSALGDINNDGIGDLFIGAPRAFTGSNRTGAGYVVFGSTTLGSGGGIELSSIDGSNGFVIDGAGFSESGSTATGTGDVNGDAIDDLIIFAPFPNSNTAYVVFGGDAVGASGSLALADLDSDTGLTFRSDFLTGINSLTVSGAGDINNDGINDVIVGQPFGSDGNVTTRAGRSSVVFGSTDLGGELLASALDGTDGFVFRGLEPDDRLGSSVSNLGDVNGDGIDDFIVSATEDVINAGAEDAGESYVIFGSSSIGSNAPLDASDLDGNNGFVIEGLARNFSLGESVSGAGDVNGDGINDLLIGDPAATPDGASFTAGEVYVIFGSVGLGNSGSLDLSTLDGNNGFVFNGVGDVVGSAINRVGSSISGAGDFNGDGVDDLIIGARNSDQSYVVFGASDANAAPIATPDTNSVVKDAADNEATGNVLNNDSDPDGDTLTVAAVNDSTADIGQVIEGQYGSFVLDADGEYTYTLDNANPVVDALGEDETLTDSFSYQVSDGSSEATTTLAITINGSTDVPNTPLVVTEAVDDGTGATSGTLSWAIQQANTRAGADIIELASDVRFDATADDLFPVESFIDSDITIEGNGFTLSGDSNNNGQVDDGDRRGLFVRSGDVVLRDLTLTGAVARGEDGNGGGAGMGGALFIEDGNVTVDTVTFENNRAIGGESAGSSFGGGIGLAGDRTGEPGRDGFVNISSESGIDGGRGGTGSFGGGGGRGGSGGGSKVLSDPGFGGSGGTGGFGGGGGRGGDGGAGKTLGGAGGFGGTGGFGGGGGAQGTDSSGKSGRGTEPPEFPISGGSGGFGGGFGNDSDSNSYGGGGAGLGGAIFIRSGTLAITNSSFNNNAAQGGQGNNFQESRDDGSGFGGAIFAITDEALQNHNGGDQGLPTAIPTVEVANTQFANNTTDGADNDIFGIPTLDDASNANVTNVEGTGTQADTAQMEASTSALTTSFAVQASASASNANTLSTDESTPPDDGGQFKELTLDTVVGLSLNEAEQTLIATAFEVSDTVNLTTFDPLAAAASDDPEGVDVLGKLITAQTVVVQTGALLQGALPQAPRATLEAVAADALVNLVQSQVDAGQMVNLADETQLQTLLETTVDTLLVSDPSLELQPVADAIPQLSQVIAASNQAALAATTADSIPEAVTTLFQVQSVAQEAVAADLQAAVAGEQSLTDVIADNTGTALADQIATVTVNLEPVAINDVFTTPNRTTLDGNVLDDNGAGADTDLEDDTLSVSSVNGASDAVGQSLQLDSGAVLTLDQDGTFTYTPDSGFAGTDTFTYTISDGNGGTDTASVTVTVDAVGTGSDLDIGLYDADTDTLITPISEGDEILASTLAGRNVTLAALVPDDSLFAGAVESMFLDLNEGAITQTENIEPYALFGDIKGDFRGGDLPVGDNQIAFDLYSQNRLKG
ncbi:MAG: Ig-like domain-containing protein, partial [Cyanobacteria bacterium P01_F01_bin.86]